MKSELNIFVCFSVNMFIGYRIITIIFHSGMNHLRIRLLEMNVRDNFDGYMKSLKQWYAKYDFIAGALKKKQLFLPLNPERVVSFSILKKS